jgi:hypothetical protein
LAHGFLLESIIKRKQSQIEANNQKTSDLLAEKEQTISQLTKVSQSALEKIENITDFIDGVL